jgi:hypothetical protein
MLPRCASSSDTVREVKYQILHIFSDNTSTDRTCEICLTYAAKDPRVRYSRMETILCEFQS